APTLQDVYNNSSAPATLTTANNKNIVFELADTVTDSDFIIRLMDGTNNQFIIEDSGGNEWFGVGGTNTVRLNAEGGNTTLGSGTGAAARFNVDSLTPSWVAMMLSGLSSQSADILQVNTSGNQG